MSEDLREIEKRLRETSGGRFTKFADLIQAVINVLPTDAPTTFQEGPEVKEVEQPNRRQPVIIVDSGEPNPDNAKLAKVGIMINTERFVVPIGMMFGKRGGEFFGVDGSDQFEAIYLSFSGGSEKPGEIFKYTPTARINMQRSIARGQLDMDQAESWGNERGYVVGQHYQWMDDNTSIGYLKEVILVRKGGMLMDEALKLTQGKSTDVVNQFRQGIKGLQPPAA